MVRTERPLNRSDLFLSCTQWGLLDGADMDPGVQLQMIFSWTQREGKGCVHTPVAITDSPSESVTTGTFHREPFKDLNCSVVVVIGNPTRGH
jgi:hypothetical protein